ncbi:hypothetical protein ABRP87_05695 [Corynebacterium sp. KPL2830]|uniref:hypothetical protein n=1 Tax=unclassified Corynebacterium TaxID=2624378 RepID=UPI0003B8CC8C|nr:MULTISPECIES: hypothetical protein [unclassified Corynebacterium]ERS51088.1 hypothetical protein HMPREF1281_01763 [Corynebacterium sp. KPL1855]ERS61568.1 hypothetical protein HMPREF1257_01928 [Corynebacterium sp. KPL1814]ERS79859.1 hypothetical protein HMPREF1285_01074 [Corynebacterium sp. KPL1859]
MAQRKKYTKPGHADRSMWKMSPERLQEHLKLRSRATRIPDKKKQQAKKACRNTRRAFPLFNPAIMSARIAH